MRYFLLMILWLLSLSCRKKEVDKQLQTQCRILSYYTDSTETATHINLVYEGDKLVGMRRKYIELFGVNAVEDTIIIYYNSDNRPSSLGTPKGPGKIAKFLYAPDGSLSSKILHNGSSFPLRKMDYHWKDGRIDIVKFFDYEIKGLANDIESYKERLNVVLEIQYDERGNVRNVKKTIVPGMSVTEIRYEYDSQPNPRRNLYELQGVNNSDYMYLLSPNNLTRATYFFEETQFSITYDSPYRYNENGYPLNGDFLNKMVNVQYQCW